ncbi:hypothetical protein [Streptomyces sp. NBC_00102]|uniref:hypothetical protein n=1 Tax=Streptomyces sp. NBC_00102 TaxID=2975652 RepID=UPI0022501F44|nr:hypothetical protein [Streptomyces sp. NBC_00102]MCX5396656.1 hypothetical protein [Streptomyces sp. NBC_00102]
MRQRIVRLTLVGGVVFLALLLLLATCGGSSGESGEGGTAGTDAKSRGATAPASSASPSVKPSPSVSGRTVLDVPPQYTTASGWEIVGASPDIAFSWPTGTLAYLERTADRRYRVRTLDTATGKLGWRGEARQSLDPESYPRLLTVSRQDRDFFVTWSYGKAGDGLAPSETFLSIDVYAAADGDRHHVELPWSGAPAVTASGPDIVVSDGDANVALIDPVTGGTSKIAASELKYPKGCTACRTLTEVIGQTGQGLLVGGAREFWVPGGWYSRDVAPKGADPASGVPTSVAAGMVLAKWQPEKSSKRAATHELWTVHDAASGKALVSVECHRPAIQPGRYPQAVVPPSGDYLIAGNLAFDLVARKGYCLEDEDGSSHVTLASVTDDGIAYGARSVRDAEEALAGGGVPVVVDFVDGADEPLPRDVRLPVAETTGVGIFRTTDREDRAHLIGYPRAD